MKLDGKCESSVFTDFHHSQGYFGAGEVPSDIANKLPRLHELFYQQIPVKNRANKTYHVWNSDFSSDIRSMVSYIQKHDFWLGLCRCKQNKGCAFRNVSAMDELYYSRAPRKSANQMLYGASGNYGLHTDGIFHFPGVRFYRVLIGLTPNDSVETAFPILQRSDHIRTNRYVIFDFDNAKHEVINHQNEHTPSNHDPYRIMLKLHFCVCDGNPNHAYMRFAIACYVAYEKITRYFMKTGTDPQNLYQFSVGLLCQLCVFHGWLMLTTIALVLLYLALLFLPKLELLRLTLGYTIILWLSVYVVAVFLLWLRYRVFGVR